jgi:hypothetical protein
MLSDEDAIDDVNPFVTHDFSLPGGVRQTGDYEEFEDLKRGSCAAFSVDDKSIFCEYALCDEEVKPDVMDKVIHPRRNIDRGFTCEKKKKNPVKVGVSNQSRIPFFGIFLILLFVTLFLLYSRR